MSDSTIEDASVHQIPSTSCRKPNPRAFSKTDCHTCKSHGRICGRQRPQCSTCLSHKVKCGGFATPLLWDRGSNLGFPQSERQRDTEKRHTRSSNSPDLPRLSDSEYSPTLPPKLTASPLSGDVSTSFRNFKFVNGRMSKRRKRSHLPSVNSKGIQEPSSHANEVVDSEPTDAQTSATTVLLSAPDVSCVEGVDFGTDPGFSMTGQFVPPDSFPDLLPSTMHPIDGQMEAFLHANTLFGMENSEGSLQDTFSLRGLNGGDGSGALGNGSWMFNMTFNSNAIATDRLNLDLVEPSTRIPASISSGTPQLTFQRRLDDLLELYDREFCVLPLTSDTSDVRMNPFRCREQTSQGSQLLLHAMLALCYRHMSHNNGSWTIEAMKHKSTAQHLLQCATQANNYEQPRKGFELGILDTILILFTLDCTCSAFGAWTTHLSLARQVLEACGGPTALQTPRVRSQVGMLVWWDATLALISREKLVMPEQYLNHILNNTNQDVWSFYDLSGCPQDLFVWLVQLARLARENELVTTMEWATFNTTPVLKVEKSIKTWKSSAFSNACSISNPDDEYETGDDEDNYQFQQDIYHCAEAWRCALLLYIERVFKWDRIGKPSPVLGKYVRSTLDHIRCCRRTSLVQKQLLLPVFLAGAETTDIDSQNMVRGYCDWWAEKSRYRMFDTVSALLEEIWDDASYSWWGAAIDKKSKYNGSFQKPMSFLLG